MRTYIFISLFYLIPFSVISQKLPVQVIKLHKSTFSEWQILDDKYQMVISGREYPLDDSVSFTLEANKNYFLQILIDSIYNPDAGLYSLQLNGEPVMLINSDLIPGSHYFPFFTGTRTQDTKITGGSVAVISDFPWQVYLIAGNSRCGGSIINDRWVLTAAHCTKTSSGSAILPSEMSVKVGANNPYNTLEGKTYNVSEVIVHEGYNNQTLDNDIALLRITDPINFANAIPVKLVSAEDVAEGAINPGVMSWVTGYGLTHVSPDVFPQSLQKVQLPIVSNSQASTVFSKIPSTDLMAGYLNGNKDACSGDSGGPLVVPVFGEYKLAGIVSWGSSNCNTYGAYTRVSDFETWIYTKSGIPRAYKPPAPTGDTIICQGTVADNYSIGTLPAATAYEWKLYPSDAGIISGNSGNASVLWNLSKTGSAAVMIRVTIGSTVSDWSKLNVKIVQNTRLISQSADTVLCAGQSISLKVGTEGYNLVYKWYKNGSLIQSGISAKLNISKTLKEDSGDYLTEIIGSCGTLFSKTMKLTVHPLTKILYNTPDVEIPFGNDVTLEVRTEGHQLTYQWQKDDTLLNNSNASQLVLHNMNAADIGLYMATVQGTCGTEKSNTIYVYVKREITSGPEVFVWPTITSNDFNVALSNDSYYDIQLISTSGKLIKKQTNCQYLTNISISTLPKGVYILYVSDKDFRKSIRLIKI